MNHLTDKQQDILKKIEEIVKKQFEGEGTGHDWWHIYRVKTNAVLIAKTESADLYITTLGALLHDIADHKFHGGSLDAGPTEARRIMSQLGLDESVQEAVVQIINEVTFKGAGVETPCSSLEAACVQDADRLDAIGAIGIARAFAYGGSKGRALYDPAVSPELHTDFQTYKGSSAPTLNHFYEKLLLLKDRMNTDTGKQLANQRHAYMQGYLQQFLSEWEGRN
jgi:uncharacterized protein